ncbi:hypothetical protein A2303_04655 [Candidatus Falkowbacteria bacterium RIFOXYB2_FULL_47_14]|uniref:Methyltransferase type 11 domain-containing protein n=1 Tax=Candidatus Falkowbacteria bacterium RIFOXYA2_FULL_47_19 TaxID=1797994 RepID=A0A1F5SHG1_9BACT|nr:MAG: hypothetical protein A2227_02490 [Candidatus Falkowbacteria bacterium RIFOXYA2_FULL_47_19]OGF35792.1 MAG: hypothetical protein A2468_03675 [Candidatus Falkowbacteria bacterium RIFOXYC2_FULL_46_15]OGF42665.1 MAG: hypothetical protein A2303_04655 [Candidatus Falkowbacteria bacterium RIFOXYB2_FULL_47_14]
MDIINDKLALHREIWYKKKILRLIYAQWYRMIQADLKSGKKKTLEIGSGTGNFKEFKSDIIASDIENRPWLDKVFDAHDMPFTDGELSNIVMIDVLHHLVDPIRFFREVGRVLEPGGRIIMLEPFPSFFSLPVYKCFHPEPFDFKKNYFLQGGTDEKKDAWESNQAIPFLLFYRQKKDFLRLFENKYEIIKKKRISFLLYPLSGGFEHRSFIPGFLFPVFSILEKILAPLASLLAFRCYIVLEKK